MQRRKFVSGLAAASVATLTASLARPAAAQAVTLHGAVQFNDDHAFNRALLGFLARVA